MSKHTKGVWTVREAANNWYIGAENGGSIATLNRIASDEVIMANARLIAAAPELLEALIAARKELELFADDEGEDYNNPKLNAAIAKATGEQS